MITTLVDQIKDKQVKYLEIKSEELPKYNLISQLNNLHT